MRTVRNIAARVMAGFIMVMAFSVMASAATVEVKTSDAVGSYLTDEKGMSLYLFKKDSPGKSACSGACVDKWPLFFAEKPTLAKGLNADDFGVIKREDGKSQSTYKGWPLYYFIKDVKAGDTTGHAVNNVWYVVAP